MNFTPVLSLYIGRQFLAAFFGALAVIMGLIYLFDVVELLRRASTHGDAGMSVILEMALFKLPQMVQLILPFAVMLGAMATFWTMTRSRELVVARSAGVSAWGMLAPVMIAAFLIGIVNVVAFNPLSAVLFKRFQALEDQMQLRGGGPLLVGESGLWLRETHGAEQMVLHARSVHQRGHDLVLGEVSIYVADSNEHFLFGEEAADGRLEDGYIHLRDIDILRPGQPVEHKDADDIASQLTLARIQDNFAAPETVSFWQLPSFIRFFESAGFSANRQKLYYQSMLSSPVLLVAMVLVAAVFSLTPNLRSGGIMVRLVGGVGAGFIFYFFSKVVYALGLSSTLPIVLAAWVPAIVAGLVGSAALFHLEDG
jgi:lipopolysaccharide export system permease protein